MLHLRRYFPGIARTWLKNFGQHFQKNIIISKHKFLSHKFFRFNTHQSRCFNHGVPPKAIILASPITPMIICNYFWNKFSNKSNNSELYLERIKQDPNTIGDVPPEELTTEMCMEAVKRDGLSIQYIPPDKLTPDICLEANKQNSEALKYFPDHICIEFIRNFPFNINFIPLDKLSDEMCLEAIKQDAASISMIPINRITEDMCLETVKSFYEGRYTIVIPKYDQGYVPTVAIARLINYLPSEKITDKLSHEIIRIDANVIKHIDPKKLTEIMCTEAIKQSYALISYIPKEKLTVELCTEAVEQWMNKPNARIDHSTTIKTTKEGLQLLIQHVPKVIWEQIMCQDKFKDKLNNVLTANPDLVTYLNNENETETSPK